MTNIILLLILYAGFAAEYAVNRFLARHLDLDGLGDFNVAVSLATICSMLFVSGGDAASNRFIPRYLEQKEWGKIKGYIVHYLKLSLLISLCASICSLAVDYGLRYYRLDKLLHESYFAMILAPALSVFTFLGGLLLAMHREYASSLTTELLKSLLFLAGISAWMLFASSINEYEAIGLLLLSLSLSVAVQSWAAMKSIPFDFYRQKQTLCIPEWRAVGKPMLIIGLANNFISVVELWCLEVFYNGEETVGAFSLLVFISSIIWINYTAFYYFLSSRIAVMEHDSSTMRKSYLGAVLWLAVINVIMVSLLAYYAELILGWFHQDMVVYTRWLWFILIGTAINSVLQLASPFLRFGGYEKEDSAISSRILLLSLFSSPLLIYFFGVEGAIVSSVLLLLIRGLWYSFRLKRLHGISLV